MSKRLYTVPDIYTDFKCKAGSCRRSCCLGWHITVSMEEYYRLIGLDCGPELRRKLDGGVYMLERPTREKYAEFSKNYFGDCHMHGDDGLCILQCLHGEDVLPSVCRYYPRSPRTIHGNECSLSASCEGVCELLMSKKEPISFVEIPLEFNYSLPESVKSPVTEFYIRVRSAFIKILQNRDYSLKDRIKTVVDAAEILSEPFKKTDKALMESACEACENIAFVNTYSSLTEDAFAESVYLIKRLTERYPIDKYTETVNKASFEEYKALSEDLVKNHPEYEIYMEQILVNHIFYEGFPFSEEKEDIHASCASLIALYAVWKTALTTCLSNDDGDESFADLTSDFYRMAENSNFDLCAAALLSESGFFAPESLKALCEL